MSMDKTIGPGANSIYLTTHQYSDSKRLEARANLHARYSEPGEPWFRWIARHAGLEPGWRVLEVGCGPGWMWENARDDFPADIALTLTDLSPGMVEEALQRVRRSWPDAAGQVADVVALPFEDASFDAVFACHMLYHVRDPARAFVEMRRVLRPGGRLIVAGNGADNMTAFYSLRASVLGGPLSDPGGATFSVADGAEAMKAGFTDIEIFDCPGRLALTSVEDTVAAMLSFPPGDTATPEQIWALEQAVEAAITAGGGRMIVDKTMGLARGTARQALSDKDRAGAERCMRLRASSI